MRGKYSKSKFYKEYPELVQIYFQGSKSNTPEDIKKLFKKTETLIKNRKKMKKCLYI